MPAVKNNGKNSPLLFLAFAIGFLAGDQVTKSLIVDYLESRDSVPVIVNIFHLTLAHNMGGAFGVLQGMKFLFLALGFIVIIGIIVFFSRIIRMQPIYQISLGAVFGGALGNQIDRVRLGYVVDFLDFRIWPIFNVADIGITVGIILLIIANVLHSMKKDETPGKDGVETLEN